MVLKSKILDSLEGQRKAYSTKKLGQLRTLVNTKKPIKTHVLVITGVRRCGKSTMMYQLSQQLKEDFVYFNFEDPRIFGFDLEDFEKFDDVVGDNVEYYFFDEIQNVPNWEVFIRHLHDRNKQIVITGSNASLLSKELGTKLTGRNIQIELFPFSYTEFCAFKKLKASPASFQKYKDLGGFPDHITSKKQEVLQQLFKDVIYRDIIVRYGIRNADTFIQIALFLISNVAKEYSLNSIAKTFKVGSANSVGDYVDWLEDSYLLFSLPRFSWSLKSIARNPRKVYTIDPAFARANSLSFSPDDGRLFENMVYLALRRKHEEIFYFREVGECDFVIKEGNKVTEVIQVCQELHYDNYEREVEGLLEAMDFFDLKEGKIITMGEADHIKKEGKTISLVSAWEWFDEKDL